MSSSFGQVFRISTWGESHGTGVGVVIDGCPSLVPVMEEDIQRELDRRRPGQSDIVTPRREEDRAEILSGVLDGKTLGTPIAISVRNKDHRSSAYDEMASTYRPSHADYTYDAKYGIRAWAGGGRASARETIGRVAAGAVARAVLKQAFPDMEVIAWVDQVHHVKASVDWEAVTASVIESNIVRTADSSAAEAMIAAIKEARDSGNSLGGVVKCVVRGCPPGLGDPVFDKLDATLAHAMMSIPATKAFAVGSGFEAAGMTGLEHNDPFYMQGRRVRTATNHSGGIQGGISNGEDILMRIGFKPTATLMIDQQTVNRDGEDARLKGRGRHDACVLPRRAHCGGHGLALPVRPLPAPTLPEGFVTTGFTASFPSLMDSSLTFYLVLGALLLGFIVLGMLKGMIKMLLFGAAVLSSVAAYFWLSKYGFTYLSFITSDPREWMVTVLSVGGAAAVFFVFMHGLFWFSDVFSWGRRMGFGGTKGIVTTVLMAAVVCWVGVMCIFFYGSMAEMTRARELALYHMDPNRTISLPAIYSIKKSIMDNPHLSWLEKISPEHDPERLSLAKMIAYLVTLSPELSDQRRTQLDCYMPRSRITSRVLSLKSLSEDPAIRLLVQKGDMQGLYNDVKLTRFLEDHDVRSVLSQLDVDRVLGFVTEIRRTAPAGNEYIPEATPIE